MGYVMRKSILDALSDPDPDVSKAAAKEGLEDYNNYREGMRSGIFGALIGGLLFPKNKDRV